MWVKCLDSIAQCVFKLFKGGGGLMLFHACRVNCIDPQFSSATFDVWLFYSIICSDNGYILFSFSANWIPLSILGIWWSVVSSITSAMYMCHALFYKQGPVRRWICTSFDTERWSGPSYKRSRSWIGTVDGKWNGIKCLCFVGNRCSSTHHSLAPPTARLQELGCFQRES